jgi:hypothetical protein
VTACRYRALSERRTAVAALATGEAFERFHFSPDRDAAFDPTPVWVGD